MTKYKIGAKFQNTAYIPRWYEGDFSQGAIKPEWMYDELTKLGSLLRLPVIQAHISFELKDANGNILDKRKDRSRTFIRNFWNFLADFALQPAGSAALYNEGYLAFKNTTAAIVSNDFDGLTTGLTLGNWMPLFGRGVATLGVSNAGIAVGTGTYPENFNSYTIGNQILSGNGAGQLAHSAQNTANYSYDYPSKTLSVNHTRIFNNNSGSSITVTEVCLFGLRTSGETIMLSRDLLASPVIVVNAAQLTVSYTLSMVYPADQIDSPFIDPRIEVNQNTASRQWRDRDNWTWDDRRWGQNPTQHIRFRWQPI